MPVKVYERLVILNHMVSRSSSKAGQEFTPPTHSAEELLGIVEMRRLLGFAVEYLGATDDTDEAIRAANGLNHDFIRLKNSYSIEEDGRKYIVLFFESANQMEKSLSVIHQRNFRGRQISGDEDEVGASTAHVVVRLPANGEYDDGSYRCAIEHVSGGVTRKNISALLRRQLRRHARAEDWTFEIYRKNKKGKHEAKSFRYSPKIDLLADVGRALADGTASSRVLTSITFTKRSERRSTANETSIKHAEYEADVAIKVAMSQGPKDPAERRTWVQRIRDQYNDQGYTSHLLFRSAGGSGVSGKVHQDVEGAADLLLCPKEVISHDAPPDRWREDVSDDVIGKLRELVDRDSLWQRAG